MRLAHWLRLLANESLALSGIVRYLSIPSPMLGAHSTFADMAGLVVKDTFCFKKTFEVK
ncbi:MAG: hypothetical protein IM602_05345 [Cytophagales bacterium]|nr:hypothetical protein [Cytophagales bacterium]MCA6417951.1 hypothetical protein [Cytophagales bacterium]MCA6425056.1 hypothetical protein [Cytophagales bacterium]